jgi:hypothetical protein
MGDKLSGTVILAEMKNAVGMIPMSVAQDNMIGLVRIDTQQRGVVPENSRRAGIEKNILFRPNEQGKSVLAHENPVPKTHAGLILAKDEYLRAFYHAIILPR